MCDLYEQAIQLYQEEKYKEAAILCEKAAEQGNVEAQVSLAYMYYEGIGVDQNYEEAAKFYTLAAEQGNHGAQFILSAMYESGKGVEKNPEKAWAWYIKSVENSGAIAQNNLAIKYEFGIEVEQNYTEALKWYLMAANQNDDDAQSAQYNLALMYEFGKGVEKSLEEALKWYLKSAENGCDTAQCRLAQMYYDGELVEQNYETAKYWFERAAKTGCSYAYYRLGNLYRDELGVICSPRKACEMWEKACEAENLFCSHAPYQLGYAYYDGWGVERDLNKAKYYFELAIENGYQCSYSLEIVKKELGEESEDNLMREYVEEIVNKRIPNSKLYDKISKDLKKDFRHSWSLMDNDTKNFLISGLFTYIVYYSTGAQIYGNLDFSQPIIEMCKALEREFGKYLYSGYVRFLKAEAVDPKSFGCKRPFIKKLSASEYDYYSPNDVKKFTLGSLEEILGVERLLQPSFSNGENTNPKNNYDLKIDDAMATYLDRLFKKEAFSEQNRKREISHYIISLHQEIQSIVASLRNPSAHTNIMKYHRAEACGNHIIKVKKLLMNFIDKINISEFNNLTEEAL